MLDAIARDAEARYLLSPLVDRSYRAEYPHRAQDSQRGQRAPPALPARQRRAIARSDYRGLLEKHGISARPVGEDGITIIEPRAMNTLPGFAEGCFSVQDAGAQLAAPLLTPQDGMRVLDACAAPGREDDPPGRARQHRSDCASTSMQRGLPALRRISHRLGCARESWRADAAETSAWWDGVPFDRIIADVPCSASGVVRRHPDVKWLRREADIAGFVAQQRRLLEALWPCLKRGGTLLYTTCSIFRAENESIVGAFTQSAGDVLRIGPQLPSAGAAIEGQLLPARGDAAHNHDGFFYALLQKR